MEMSQKHRCQDFYFSLTALQGRNCVTHGCKVFVTSIYSKDKSGRRYRLNKLLAEVTWWSFLANPQSFSYSKHVQLCTFDSHECLSICSSKHCWNLNNSLTLFHGMFKGIKTINCTEKVLETLLCIIHVSMLQQPVLKIETDIVIRMCHCSSIARTYKSNSPRRQHYFFWTGWQ